MFHFSWQLLASSKLISNVSDSPNAIKHALSSIFNLWSAGTGTGPFKWQSHASTCPLQFWKLTSIWLFIMKPWSGKQQSDAINVEVKAAPDKQWSARLPTVGANYISIPMNCWHLLVRFVLPCAWILLQSFNNGGYCTIEPRVRKTKRGAWWKRDCTGGVYHSFTLSCK